MWGLGSGCDASRCWAVCEHSIACAVCAHLQVYSASVNQQKVGLRSLITLQEARQRSIDTSPGVPSAIRIRGLANLVIQACRLRANTAAFPVAPTLRHHNSLGIRHRNRYSGWRWLINYCPSGKLRACSIYPDPPHHQSHSSLHSPHPLHSG